jgi:acyl dehydratase
MSSASRVCNEHTFSQEEFDRFAVLSGDNNPIHVDAVFASNTKFERTVAHGLLLCSRLRGLVEQLLPGGVLIDQSVMFEAPTFAGEPMLLSAAIVETDMTGAEVELEVSRILDHVVTCRGRCRVGV